MPSEPRPIAISARVGQNSTSPVRRGRGGGGTKAGLGGGIQAGGWLLDWCVARLVTRVDEGVGGAHGGTFRGGGRGGRAAPGRGWLVAVGCLAPLAAGCVDHEADQPDHQEREQREREAAAVTEERGAEDERRGDHGRDDEDHPAHLGAELDRGTVPAVLGHEQPEGAVHEQAGAAEEREHREQHPDDRGVDVEVAAQPAGDTGEVAVGGAAAQPAQVAHLLRADAGPALAARAAGRGCPSCCPSYCPWRGHSARSCQPSSASSVPGGIGEGPDSSGPNVRGVT